MKQLKELLLTFCFVSVSICSMAQNREISGRVVAGTNNTPVAGATVTVKGTNRSVAAAEDGSFSIAAPSGSVTLTVSSINYAAQDIPVDASQNNIVISLSESGGQLGEVVVTALGIQRQAKTLVYATQSVRPSELTEARDPNNVLNSLQGKVANATITQGSGGPGSGARIVLRGNRSIQGSNNALIVVDGVPINNGTNGTAGSDFGSVQGSDGASNINPDDIESVTVLRGASAAALYGSQAGNGVIVITTKKGTRDKISVTLNSGLTMEKAWSLPKVQNQYGQGNGGVFRDTLTSGESWGAKMEGQSYINFLGEQRRYEAQPDNIKDFFRTGVSLNNSIGVSGGTERVQTYLSYTHNSIQGIVPKNNLLRHTVNLRLTTQVTKQLSLDGKVTYIAQDIKNRPRTGEENAPVVDIYQIARNIPTSDAKRYEVFNSLGLPEPTKFPTTLSSIYQNAYWVINRTAINETRDRVIGFLTAKYNITNWLSISGRANLDRTFDRGERQYSEGTILWANPGSGGVYFRENILVTSKWFDAILEGNNKITNNLKINYRIGGIYQDNKYDYNSQNSGGLNVTNKFSLNFAKAPAVNSAFTQVQTQSVFGQANISFKDAIFLDASLRNDWDSRLPEPYTFQYPSVGVSAILSDLITLPQRFSFLKASINYAEVGNGGQFGLLNTVYNYGQGAGNGFLQRGAVYPIPGLKPEIVKNLEFGIEARFINNRIGFTATYYKSNSTNQLLRVALPVATGYSSKYINAGNIQNKGVELVINGSPVRGEDFNWDVTFNVALNRNKIISLSDEIKRFPLSGGFGRSATPVVEEGGSYGDLLGQTWATDAKGSYVVDSLGKPVIITEQTYIGNFNPRETFGFTNTFTYKGLSLRVLIDGRTGGTIVSGTEMNLAFSGIPEVTEQYREGGWNLGGVRANGTPVAATIRAQDFWQIASGKRYGVAQFFAYDATNFRVREVSLGYNFDLPSAFAIKGAKLSLVGRNLLWLYRGESRLDIPGVGKRKMWFDPDMSLGNGNFQGIEYGTLPSTRSYGVNLQLNF
jgi:TonB-linked SusC/RagA family outer membrane protein